MRDVWTAFYWRDYIGDTLNLSLAEHGAYLLLMAHYYINGEGIPASREQVHRICRCATNAERRAAEQVINSFFTRDGQVFRHKRIEAEISRSSELREKRRESGRLGGQASAQASARANGQQEAEQNRTSHSHSNNYIHSKGGESTERAKSAPPLPLYTQADFDARDLRKMSDAYEEWERRSTASQGSYGKKATPTEVFEFVCEKAGITVERGLQLEALQKKWPAREESA